MKSYLLNAEEFMFDQIEDAAAAKSMSKADFIRESIARNLRYFMKVERTRYEQQSKKAINEPLEFFASAFWKTETIYDTSTH